MKRILAIILSLAILIISLTSCENLKSRLYVDGYPNGFTSEFCLENYIPLESNYKYLYCDEKIVDNTPYEYKNSKIAFRSIPCERPTSYIAAIAYSKVGAETYEAYHWLMIYKDVKVSPFEKRAISSIELYLGNTATADDLKWGADQYVSLFANISKYEEDILGAISGDWSLAEDTQGLTAVTKNGYLLNIRICFEDHQNIVWDSVIYRNQDGEYFFSSYKIDKKGADALISKGEFMVIPVPDSLAEIIEDTIN